MPEVPVEPEWPEFDNPSSVKVKGGRHTGPSVEAFTPDDLPEQEHEVMMDQEIDMDVGTPVAKWTPEQHRGWGVSEAVRRFTAALDEIDEGVRWLKSVGFGEDRTKDAVAALMTVIERVRASEGHKAEDPPHEQK